MSEINKKAAEQELAKLAEQVFVNETKVYAVGNLSTRFQLTAQVNRQDQTIQQVARVITTIADRNPGTLVSSQELEGLMHQFYVPGTNFRSEFEDLLDEATSATQKNTNRLEYEGDYRSLDEVKDIAAEVDFYNDESDIQPLVDPSVHYSKLDEPHIRFAATLVDEELKYNQIKTTSLKLKYNAPEILMYQASFNTPTGEANVYIPVELKDGNPLIPQVMSTTDKVYSLDSSGFHSLVQDLAEDAHIRKAEHVNQMRMDLGMFDELRNDNMNVVEVDEFEDLPQKEVHLGIDEIENVLRDAVVRKESKYATTKIDAGANLVAMELSDIGYKNAQVKFAGDRSSNLFYDATINTEYGKFHIQVPVEATRGSLLAPHAFISGGKEFSLTHEAMQQAIREGNTQENVHPLLYGMSYPELKKQLKSAAYEHKPKLAKNVLALIQEKFDSYYHSAAIDDYQTWLEEASSSYQSRCAGCNYYNPKSGKHADWCNLIKTATKDVSQDQETGICTRSIFEEVEEESDKIAWDSGTSIKL